MEGTLCQAALCTVLVIFQSMSNNQQEKMCIEEFITGGVTRMVNSAPEPGRGESVCIPAPRTGRRPYQTGSAGRQRQSRAGSMQFTSTRQSMVKKEAIGLIDWPN